MFWQCTMKAYIDAKRRLLNEELVQKIIQSCLINSESEQD
jgi:hypothetical protein